MIELAPMLFLLQLCNLHWNHHEIFLDALQIAIPYKRIELSYSTVFPEIHRDQRSSIDSAPPSFTSMAIMVSDSDPEEGGQCNPSKLWTFGLSILPSYEEPLKLPQKITTLSAPAAWKIFRLSECARTPYHSSGSNNSGAFIIAYKFESEYL